MKRKGIWTHPNPLRRYLLYTPRTGRPNYGRRGSRMSVFVPKVTVMLVV